MTTSSKATLVLGGTGRTGSLVARRLIAQGIEARTAARRSADLIFDWDDPLTYSPALQHIDRIYLVSPVGRVKFAPQVAEFLDLAEAAGVRHVTYLSAYGSDLAPPEIDIRAIEIDLAHRSRFSHSILRPAWVMQNFADAHLPLVNDVLVVPSGGGAEAFVDGHDIAAVAVATLTDPDTHAGMTYAPTGPKALTFAEVAAIIAAFAGRTITYNDIDQSVWIDGAIAAGFVPADYGVMLRWLTGMIISGKGSLPNDDVERITGRPATSFADFARRNASAWAPASAE